MTRNCSPTPPSNARGTRKIRLKSSSVNVRPIPNMMIPRPTRIIVPENQSNALGQTRATTVTNTDQSGNKLVSHLKNVCTARIETAWPSGDNTKIYRQRAWACLGQAPDLAWRHEVLGSLFPRAWAGWHGHNIRAPCPRDFPRDPCLEGKCQQTPEPTGGFDALLHSPEKRGRFLAK